MAKEKKSFVMYSDLIHTVKKLSDEEAGKLLKHILMYVNDEDPETDSVIVDLVFEPIKQQLKRDLKHWETKREKRREAGRRGGLAKASNAKQSKANLAVNVNDNVNVTVNGNVNDNVLLEKETKFIFKRSLIDFGFDESLVEDWLKVRKTKKARNTKTAFEGFIREVKKCTLDKNEILRECVERSWSGFKADWLNQNTLNNGNSKKGNGDINQALHDYINS